MTIDDDRLKTLFREATDDLRAPRLRLEPGPSGATAASGTGATAVTAAGGTGAGALTAAGGTAPPRHRPARRLVQAAAAAAAVAAAVAVVVTLVGGIPATTPLRAAGSTKLPGASPAQGGARQPAGSSAPGSAGQPGGSPVASPLPDTSHARPFVAGPSAAPTPSVAPSGQAVLDRLAASIRALSTPSGRYVVQIEQQTEGSTSYLKASIIDSRTGDTWTYQRGDGVPAALPMAPHFSPTEAQIQARYPTSPGALRSALIAQATAGSPTSAQSASAQDLAVSQAIDTLWNPLVQPELRSALVSVIAGSPGVTVDAHATDTRGRKAIEISYVAASLHLVLSVFLDPATGTVLQSSQRPTGANGSSQMLGSDLYLSQYWTDTSPTVDPLNP